MYLLKQTGTKIMTLARVRKSYCWSSKKKGKYEFPMSCLHLRFCKDSVELSKHITHPDAVVFKVHKNMQLLSVDDIMKDIQTMEYAGDGIPMGKTLISMVQ